jgi:hypothetical protein
MPLMPKWRQIQSPGRKNKNKIAQLVKKNLKNNK